LIHKAEDTGSLTPGKDDNVANRKIDRKDVAHFNFMDYISKG
jgi:hypothetical protein